MLREGLPSYQPCRCGQTSALQMRLLDVYEKSRTQNSANVNEFVHCSEILFLLKATMSPLCAPQCSPSLYAFKCLKRFYITSTAFSSLSLMLSSPLTSAFSLSRFSIKACSSASSFSVTAFGSIFTTQLPFAFSMFFRISTMASSKVLMPTDLSKHVLVRT